MASTLSVNQQLLLLASVLTLANLAKTLHESSRIYLLQQSLCFTYFAKFDPSKIDRLSRIDESLCRQPNIQAPLAVADGIDAFLRNLPAFLVMAMYKEFLPIVGLRSLLLLNIGCSALGVLYSIANFSLHQSWTTTAIISSSVFDIVGGGEITRILLLTTCIALMSPPEKLTNTYNYISACNLLATVFGSTIGSLLLSDYVYLLNGVSIACYVFTICTICLISDHLGQGETCLLSGDRTPLNSDSEIMDYRDHSRSAENHAQSKLSYSTIIARSWRNSYRSITTLFAVPCPTLTVLIIFLLNGLATGCRELLYQYTSLALKWPLATVNRAVALQAMVSAVVLLLLPTVRRAYLEPRMNIQQIDLFITRTSLIVNTAGAIGLGFSATTTIFVVSLCVYTSGAGLADSLTTYGTLTLPENFQVADFYVRTNLISAISALLGAPFWSSLFNIVIRSENLPLGMPFWLCAALYAAGVGGMKTLKSRASPNQDEHQYSPIMRTDDRPR